MVASRVFLIFAAAFALIACGSDSSNSEPPTPTDPLAAYKNQTVQWHSCNQYFFDTSEAAAYLAKLGTRAQCADIKAPLDYQKPDGLQLSISMLHVQAGESPEQKPNLFFNPGGPGGDGLTDSLSFSMLLASGSDGSTLGSKYKEVSESYNFIGFSPRGVGASTRIMCAGNELVYETDNTKWGEDAQNLQKITDTARYTATNCQKNPVADHIHTDATARDMDLIRHLLGDEKLHYYGTSYGTWLGFWYAGIFPDRIGPMVLDSNMNFNDSILTATITYVEGQIHTFKKHIAPYAARHDAILGMGTSAESIIHDLNSLGRATTQALLDIGGSFRAEPEGIPEYLCAVKAAIETQKLLNQGKTLDEIESILTTGQHMGNEELNTLFKSQARSLIDAINRMLNPQFYTEPRHFSLDNDGSVWQTVVCNDEAIQNTDQAFWTHTAFEQAKRLSIASNRLAGQPCLSWNRPADITEKPTLSTLKNAPFLMVQSEFDVPTPLSGAMETFNLLPAAHMVYVQNEGAHGLMMYETECVDLTVMDYLLGKMPRQRLTECQAKPLPLDETLLAAEPFTAASIASAKAPAASNFDDPELAAQLKAHLKNATRW